MALNDREFGEMTYERQQLLCFTTTGTVLGMI